MAEIDLIGRDGSVSEFITREKQKAIQAYRNNEEYKNKIERKENDRIQKSNERKN